MSTPALLLMALGHDDGGNGLVNGRHDAVDPPGATHRRLKGSRL